MATDGGHKATESTSKYTLASLGHHGKSLGATATSGRVARIDQGLSLELVRLVHTLPVLIHKV